MDVSKREQIDLILLRMKQVTECLRGTKARKAVIKMELQGAVSRDVIVLHEDETIDSVVELIYDHIYG